MAENYWTLFKIFAPLSENCSTPQVSQADYKPARYHTISLKKRGWRHIFTFVLMQTCAGLKEHMREAIDYAFCAFCIVCQGSAVGWSRQDRNRQCMQQVQNHARSQLGTRVGANSFLRGAQIF